MPILLKGLTALRAKAREAAEGLSRSKGWTAVFVSSVVVLIVFSDLLSGKFHSATQLYIVAACSVGMILGFFFTVASYFKRLEGKIYGGVMEAVFAVANVAIWSIALGILQSPKNNYASTEISTSTITGTDSILNANLYFASWFAFGASSAVLISILKELGVTNKVSFTSIIANVNRWFLLLVSSLVVLVSSLLLETRTNRAIFAISVGVITSVLPLLIIFSTFTKYKAGLILQMSMAMICVGLYSFEVAFITSPKGPGHGVSNLYFSSWISFILSISIFMNILDEYVAQNDKSDPEPEEPPKESVDPEIQEEEEEEEEETKPENNSEHSGDVLRL